ncbi:uncharacterized protein FIBRA_03398 [Fibroporia radiculosa]|uniref:Altered inheritance of mitochondria protein 11 n=1 Tax=Fibroporia radiculosa TaxID=599839 RepID=J4G5C3_9APHY|nr:uncharacterized protein FIBRA_03398 [Fibroporia radiculosa]CCM01348.1 predicted protein [Fibroporia radiculosa]
MAHEDAPPHNSATIPGDRQDESEYKPVFGLSTSTTNTVPRWLPISLLALTTAALAVPAVLLWRQRAPALGKVLTNNKPPPRRTTATVILPAAITPAQRTPPPRRRTAPSVAVASPAIPASSATSSTTETAPMLTTDQFNGALYSAKAFGIATLVVSVVAGTGVWGVKAALDVQNTQEFATRMRQLILTRMPVLASRIHRPLEPDDGLPSITGPHPTPEESLLHTHGTPRSIEWSWPDAEQRLRDAFEKDGISGWAAAAMHELEAEGQIERRKRSHV